MTIIRTQNVSKEILIIWADAILMILIMIVENR